MKETMRAAVFRGPREFEVTHIPVPQVGPDDVLLRVLICFFPILVNMIAGLEAVPKTMLDLMRSRVAEQEVLDLLDEPASR